MGQVPCTLVVSNMHSFLYIVYKPSILKAFIIFAFCACYRFVLATGSQRQSNA